MTEETKLVKKLVVGFKKKYGLAITTKEFCAIMGIHRTTITKETKSNKLLNTIKKITVQKLGKMYLSYIKKKLKG